MRSGPDVAEGNAAQRGSQERTTGIFVLGLQWEIHQERTFIRIAIVIAARAGDLKAEFFVEGYGGKVGFADFEKDRADR